MCQIYEYVKSEKGKSIILSVWKAAGITKAFKKGCAGEFQDNFPREKMPRNPKTNPNPNPNLGDYFPRRQLCG